MRCGSCNTENDNVKAVAKDLHLCDECEARAYEYGILRHDEPDADAVADTCVCGIKYFNDCDFFQCEQCHHCKKTRRAR